MKKLLSLPSNLVNCISDIVPQWSEESWFCTSDPADSRLGSGAGTAWLLDRYEQSGARDTSGKKIIIHAGGQSRRLPAYAPIGKVFTPIPVMRWAVGEKIDQTLLDLQLPLYEKIMLQAPGKLNTLIASGDVCIRANSRLPQIPADADVVCYGMWVDATLASHHGVFMNPIESPEELDFMLQKPSPAKLAELSQTHLFLMDIGLWLLSDKALELLRRRSHNPDGSYKFYDLYSEFGCALGKNPSADDEEINRLKVVIIPLSDGEFYHFGTSRELLSSTLALQNLVADQRLVFHRSTKPGRAQYIQNCMVDSSRLTAANTNIWIENACVGPKWLLRSNHIITGVPRNDWQIDLPDSVCVDMVPVGEKGWAIRPYGYDDAMRGSTTADTTLWMGKPVTEWCRERGVTMPEADLQSAPIFPVITNLDDAECLINWIVSDASDTRARELWMNAEKLSADMLLDNANLRRAQEQRIEFQRNNISLLGRNYNRSVFYQLDLDHLATLMQRENVPAPAPVDGNAPVEFQIRNAILRGRLLADKTENERAFRTLRDAILETAQSKPVLPTTDVYSDQIVWGRSPVRIDVAGGWTDTPPYSLFNGGKVVNLAVELNGQPPLQVFVKPAPHRQILLRSIDLGASETIDDYETLLDFKRVNSPFSIPKAALALCGFAPGFCEKNYRTLRQQLDDFGFGIEITLLSAVPAGSGLGTSSILAATVLGALNDFCRLGWGESEIGTRTLVLEQLLTSGGGWQDQYGGLLGGVKLLETSTGILQQPSVNWLTGALFADPEFAPCHLLYYTGVTRTAKHILQEIVQRMFLNSGSTLSLLGEMKEHAIDTAAAIQRRDFTAYGKAVAKTWIQNQKLDSGTNPDSVKRIIKLVEDYTLGLKLPGAGGGGFLYMVAKDTDAASRIRRILQENTPNPRARMVEMSLCRKGLQISRS